MVGPPDSSPFSAGNDGFTAVRTWVDFIGNKNIALFIGAFISMVVLARSAASDSANSRKWSVHPRDGRDDHPHHQRGWRLRSRPAQRRVGDAVKTLAQGYSINLIFLGWIVAVVVRVAQGSATVAMLTASSIMAPMVVGTQLGCHPVYLFMSIGFGAMFCSWMNDSGFWAVSKLSGMTEKETLRTWSLQLTANSIFGLVVVLLLSKILPLV